MTRRIENNTVTGKQRFEDIMNTPQRTLTRITKQRYFSDLIYKRFDICEILSLIFYGMRLGNLGRICT